MVLTFIGPPKIVGANEVCLMGEDENSARARGLNPDFWGIGVNPVTSLDLVSLDLVVLVFSVEDTWLEDEVC